MEKALLKLESFLDKAFAAPVDALYRSLDRFFEYTYRETDEGIFGLFNSPEKMKTAAKAARDKGYTNFDCLTPFPIHGLEFDMGLKRSRIPYITLFAGLIGVFTGFFLQTFVHEQIIPPIFEYLDIFPNIRSYPLNIGGKPTFSWPAMVPICFELTVLFAGHSTVIGLLLLSRMPKANRKVLHPDITNDKFCLWLPSDSAGYSEDGARRFLSELGAQDITMVKGGEPQV